MAAHLSAPATAPGRRARAVVAVLTALAVAGCGVPPELHQSESPSSPGAPSAPTSVPTAPAPPATGLPSTTPGLSSPSADAGLVATPCRGGPTGERVINVLRGGAAVLPDGVRVKVGTEPLCAADWQYTVLEVTGHEELQVVTRGRPAAPQLVTAGTDVCNAEVRVVAPPGIRTLACDNGTVGIPGA
ncbi:hypothetical protein D7044_22475 [Micromonospora musae]|uniref:Uncharacterized protein n=1 Tax=Micromonospora musae TaxID=1894970 RepID=A0A3A9Y776_9ACTN|nr:hypothetical protein D7044_22475 [Micromonospora musae]